MGKGHGGSLDVVVVLLGCGELRRARSLRVFEGELSRKRLRRFVKERTAVWNLLDLEVRSYSENSDVALRVSLDVRRKVMTLARRTCRRA